MDKKTPKPKKKIRTTPILKELLELQSELIKNHDAIPSKEGYLNWTPARAHEWKTKKQLLEKEKKKLETEFKKATEEEAQFSIKGGLGALFLGGALQNEGAMGAATAYLAAGIGKKISGGLSNLFKKKDKTTLENETLENETLDQSSPKPKVRKPEKVEKEEISPSDSVRSFYKRGGAAPNELTKGAPEKIETKPDFLMTAEIAKKADDKREEEIQRMVLRLEAALHAENSAKINSKKLIPAGTPEKIETKPGFLMTAEDKIRARDERINPKKTISEGAPEKIETKPGFLMTAEDKIRARDERINPKKTISEGAPEKIETKPGFLMTAEDKIRARDERINPKKTISEGAPEKIEGKKENISSDNDAIISILNKILASFQSDNERMRRSIRDAAEKKLESDPTPDTPGAPVKEGDDDKKSGMNKLLMFGAIAGLLIAAYKFKDEIAEILRPITDALGITDPLKESNKEDYEFDIMDALGVTALLGMLGIAGVGGKPGEPGAKPGAKPGEPTKAGAPEKAGPGNARPRHPAGAKNAAGKSIGGQFMKALPKEGITKLIMKRVAGAAGKIIPGLGLALGLYDAYDRAMKGDVVGASLAAAGGAAGLLPGIGTGVSIAAAAANIARDVYNEAYGVFPEADEGGDVAKNLKSIMDETIESLTNKKPGPPMSAADKDKLEGPLKAYADEWNLKRAGMGPFRKKLAGNVYKEADRLGISREVVDTELGEARDSATGQNKADDSLKALQNSAASGKAESAAEAASAAAPSAAAPAAGVAPGAAGAAGSAPSAGAGGAPTSTGVAKGDMPVGSPVPSAPPPASETSGSAITSATMESSAAQNTITVLPPVINNQTNTSSSNPARESKANKITMQIRMDDEMFRTAVNATAAVLKTLKAA